MCVCTLFGEMASAQKTMSTKHPSAVYLESVRRGEIGRDGFDQQVGTSQSTWTSKPLSFLMFVYISWREVFGRIFFNGKQVAQKSQRLGIVWGDPSESESWWLRQSKMNRKASRSCVKLKKREMIWIWVRRHIFATFWFSRENGCSL